jgi:hypothetical protein
MYNDPDVISSAIVNLCLQAQRSIQNCILENTCTKLHCTLLLLEYHSTEVEKLYICTSLLRVPYSSNITVLLGKVMVNFIHSSMALHPSVGPWPLLQLCNLFYTDGRTPWTRDQPVARPLLTHRTQT